MPSTSEEPVVPAAVAHAARYPMTNGPDPASWAPVHKVRTDRWTAVLSAMPGVNLVEPFAVAPSEAGSALGEVRDLLRQHGRSRSCWSVDRGSELHTAFVDHGLRAYEEPPLEPDEWHMVLLAAPSATGNPAVEVRVAATLDDLLARAEMVADILGFDDDDRAGYVDYARASHAGSATEPDPRTVYLALLDGRLVGEAETLPFRDGLYLNGSSVVADARGLGVYQRLVHARWEAAVARGTPALTVSAGAMSRPRLEAIGFRSVAEVVNLRDDLPA